MIHSVKSTHAILAYKVLNYNIDQFWVDWAVEMLMNGYDTEHLVILAGISPPYDQFELHSLTDKVLNELHLDYGHKDQVIKNYVSYLLATTDFDHFNINEVLKALREIRDLYLVLDQAPSLRRFYCLYYGIKDLQHDTVQWYVDGMDRENMKEVVQQIFSEW
ncbi:hypothetical protein [Pedobacter helvus]|uniref:Uncharacterized protein n=1 Tax=Pedobacter helvus TaxID=2563444 RepID=A0ABW9JL86_9SPHI|nr:hypothetical protein [Pedobacter ureilyticus]